MFTQCPECGTVFKVTAPVLRAAQGQVRCGVCDASFDALRSLTDTVDAPPPGGPPEAAAPAAPAAAPRPPAGVVPPPISRATATRSTPSEDEGRALAELAARLHREARGEKPPAPAPARPGADGDLDEANVLEPDDVEDIELGEEELGGEEPAIPDEALEFDAPPAEWERVFVSAPRPRPRTALDINLSALEDERAGPDPSATDSHRFTLIEEPGGPAATGSGELTLVEEDALSRTDEYATLNADPGETEAPAAGIEDSWFGHKPADGAPAAAEAAIAEAPAAVFGEAAPADAARERLKRRAFLAGSVLLALALAAQLVHHNREALAANALAGPAVSALYARLGAPIEPRWDLAAYDVKQWGAATDAAPGALRLRASIINKASRAQPFPLLRVTLEDRFGAQIARGEFAPSDYLPGRAAPQGMLEPGARADADLMLDDPGSQAVGFEIDVCLKRAAGLVCGAEQKSPGGN